MTDKEPKRWIVVSGPAILHDPRSAEMTSEIEKAFVFEREHDAATMIVSLKAKGLNAHGLSVDSDGHPTEFQLFAEGDPDGAMQLQVRPITRS